MLQSGMHDWQTLKILLCDIDGVLSDGSLPYGAGGQQELCFQARDGSMIKRAIAVGLQVGVCSGRAHPASRIRAEELGCAPLGFGVEDKVSFVDKYCLENSLNPENIAYIGDDLPDIPVMRHVGWSVAVADAQREVRKEADYVCTVSGGRGAVAEILRYLLRKQGRELLHVEGHHG